MKESLGIKNHLRISESKLEAWVFLEKVKRKERTEAKKEAKKKENMGKTMAREWFIS